MRAIKVARMTGVGLAAAITLSGCAAVPGCKPDLERWTMTELFLGLNGRQGMVTEMQFQDFVAIAAADKSRFEQDAVLRVDTQVCAAF